MTYTILLTTVSHDMAADMIMRLRSSPTHDLRVIAVDRHPDVAARKFADVFECVETWDPDGFALEILRLVERHKVDLVLPVFDGDVLALAPRHACFSERNCVLACNSVSMVETLSNKLLSYEMFTHAGLPVADWRAADSREHLIAAVEQMFGLYGEVVVKPAVAQAGSGVSVIRDSVSGAQEYLGGRELHMDYNTFMTRFIDVYDTLFPVLVMKRLREPVHDVDVLAWKGELLRCVPRRRCNTTLPNEGHQMLDAPILQDLARDVAKKLDLSWLVDCDIMFDEAGAVCLLEVNPRPSHSVVVSLASGVPLLDDMITLAKGDALTLQSPVRENTVAPYKTMSLTQSNKVDE